MLGLRKASIVILAQTHNPSIVSPDWVQSALLVKEAPTNFVHTPPFSLFESPSWLLTVDTGRLELASKVLDEEHISACGRMASAYFRRLPHVPYRSMGLNYIWEYSPESQREPFPEVKVVIDGLNLHQVFPVRSIEYGGTMKLKLKPYTLTVRLDYEGERTIVFNYNFSCVVESARKAANVTNSFLSLKSRSQEFTESILTRGE